MTTDLALAGRLPAIDLLKVLASQVIVWHHLVLYGPMARSARPAAESWIDWLADDGRAAVYAFLVIAGYLAAGTLLPRPGRPARITGLAGGLQIALQRYRRLAPPYLVAVGLAVVVAAFARWAMTDPDTPLAPGAGQLVAHALLLHDLLGYPALSAGVWYVAIDLQLYLLLAVVAWLAQRAGRGAAFVAGGTVLALSLASWVTWNRQEALSAYAVYFFGAYGLGVLARWSREAPPAGSETSSVDRRRSDRLHPARCEWLAVMMAVGGVALLADPDRRELVAVGVALVLGLAPRQAPAGWGVRMLAALSQRSYSLFLIHYPVCLLGNALFARVVAAHGPASPTAAALGLVATWLAANVVAEGLHRWVERPSAMRRHRAWSAVGPSVGETRAGPLAPK